MKKICLVWGKLIPPKVVLQRDLCEIWDVMWQEKLFWACGCDNGVMWLILEFVEAKKGIFPNMALDLGGPGRKFGTEFGKERDKNGV